LKKSHTEDAVVTDNDDDDVDDDGDDENNNSIHRDFLLNNISGYAKFPMTF